MDEPQKFDAVPATYNKDLIESYDFTTMRDNFGIYGQRILLRLIEAANATGIIEGLQFSKGDCKQISPARVESDLFGHTRICMPMSAITGNSYEYSKLKAELRACMCHIIEGRKANGKTVLFPFLTYAEYDNASIELEVRHELWETFLNFTKGFRRFELDVALSFSSKYALKIYKLISGQKEPLSYSLEDLRKILGLTWFEEKKDGRKKVLVEKTQYQRPADLINRVIIPAKEELDLCSPYTFEFEPMLSRKSKTGRPSITGITFYPKYQPKFRDTDLENQRLSNQISLFREHEKHTINQQQKQRLIHKFGFTLPGIQHNLDTFDTAVEYLDFDSVLDSIAVSVSKQRPDNIPGYVIKSIIRALDEVGIKVPKKSKKR